MGMPSNNKTPIMGNCLSCQGLVRVPATAPSSSTVKCPHCDQSYRLSEILNQAVPELKIVQDAPTKEENDQEAAAKDAEGRFVVANQLRQSSKRSRRARRRRQSSRSESSEGMVPVPKPIAEIEPQVVSQPVAVPQTSPQKNPDPDTSQFAVNERPRESFDSRRSSGASSRNRESSSANSSRSRSSSRRSSSREPSVFFEIFKVIFGGALAIPIAYLLVLWVFKQDPLHIAPKISQTAPFLLPEQFKAEEDEDTSSSFLAEETGAGEDANEVLDVSSGLPDDL